MVQVTGLRWMGVRTEDVQTSADFFRDVLGLETLHDEPDFSVLSVADGSTVEIFGPTSRFNQHLEHPTPGFFVTDIDEAHAELVAAGAEIVLPIQRADGRAWLHFRAPDGFVYGLTQVW